jgi:hypothetical protein
LVVDTPRRIEHFAVCGAVARWQRPLTSTVDMADDLSTGYFSFLPSFFGRWPLWVSGRQNGGGEPGGVMRFLADGYADMRGLDTTVFFLTGGLGLHLESSARPTGAGLAHNGV